MTDRLALTPAERVALIQQDRGRPLDLDAAIALLLERGKLEQVCPDCGRRAGTDWVARGELLHEALLFLLTPERSADA
jgi:hypothetical protein